MHPVPRLAPFIGLLAVTTALAAQEHTLRNEPLAKGVFLLGSNNPREPNALLVVGTETLLLVDGGAASDVEQLLGSIRTRSPLPVRAVVQTHWHPDHTRGNAALRAKGATVWSHSGARRRMRSGNPVEFLNVNVPPAPAAALPERTFAGPQTFQLGRQEVRVVPVGPAHTDGDVLVHLPTANVLHMGDLMLGRAFPIADLGSGGDVQGLVSALNLAIALADDSTRIVPGHGPLVTRVKLIAYRDMLASVWGRVQAGVAAGRTLEEVLAQRPAAEFETDWSTPVVPTEGFIRNLYRSARDDAGLRP